MNIENQFPMLFDISSIVKSISISDIIIYVQKKLLVEYECVTTLSLCEFESIKAYKIKQLINELENRGYSIIDDEGCRNQIYQLSHTIVEKDKEILRLRHNISQLQKKLSEAVK